VAKSRSDERAASEGGLSAWVRSRFVALRSVRRRDLGMMALSLRCWLLSFVDFFFFLFGDRLRSGDTFVLGFCGEAVFFFLIFLGGDRLRSGETVALGLCEVALLFGLLLLGWASWRGEGDCGQIPPWERLEVRW
jgi:hypothetical protein